MLRAVFVRDATPGDFDAMVAIYAHWVACSTATFDLAAPALAERAAWFARCEAGDPVLVADDGDAVVGFAYYGAYRSKPGYAATKETTIYVAPDARRRGAATALYGELIERARRAGVHTLIGVVSSGNPESDALHRRFGFEPVGTLREVGRKFDRWVDTIFWQRIL